MARTFKNFDVFIFPPSDVAVERDIFEKAIELINQIRGTKEGFRLPHIRWEKDVGSQFGNKPQDIINQQLSDAYDIFIGILCTRVGQKTENYDSGPESIRVAQADFSTRLRFAFTSAFAISMGLRMMAAIVTFAGFPAARRGLRPPRVSDLPFHWPGARVWGARPARLPACGRPGVPISGRKVRIAAGCAP